jgi:hypothetical protein
VSGLAYLFPNGSTLMPAPNVAEIGRWLIIGLVIGGIIAIAMFAAQAAGIVIPPLFMNVLYVILAVVVGAGAIKFLLSLVPGSPTP